MSSNDNSKRMSMKQKQEFIDLVFYLCLSILIFAGYKFIYDLGILDGSINVLIDAFVIIASVIGTLFIGYFMPFIENDNLARM